MVPNLYRLWKQRHFAWRFGMTLTVLWITIVTLTSLTPNIAANDKQEVVEEDHSRVVPVVKETVRRREKRSENRPLVFRSNSWEGSKRSIKNAEYTSLDKRSRPKRNKRRKKNVKRPNDPIGLNRPLPLNRSASANRVEQELDFNFLAHGDQIKSPLLQNMPWLDLPDSFSATGYNSKILRRFRRQISKEEYDQYMDLFRVFNHLAHEHNLLYFICGGTLLGSYRHHDMIPWDDDIDVYMPIKSRKAMVEFSKEYEHLGYHLDTRTRRYKFFKSNSLPVKNKGWEWPFIDINFYSENKTHFWDISPAFREQYIYKKADVFPLHYRPFGPLYVPAPRDSFAVIRGTYDLNTGCLSSHYSHKFEAKLQNMFNIPCEIFSHYYPMVHREPGFFGVKETLKLSDWSIQSLEVLEPHHIITKTYELELKR